VIGHQIAAPPGKMPIPNLTPTKPGLGQPTPTVTPVASPATPVQQKVQIVKSADGKIQVRGLLPGQQLVQMPDGRLQIFSNQQVPAGPHTVIQNTQPQMMMASSRAVTQPQVVKQNQVVQQQPLTFQQQLQLLANTNTIKRTPNLSHTPNFTPIQPKPQPQVTSSSVPQTPVKAAGTKHNVGGIQGLGNNSVSIKDNQLVIQDTNDAITKSKLCNGRMDADMMIEEATREEESIEHEDCEDPLNVSKDPEPEHTKRGSSADQPNQTADFTQNDQSGLVENPRKRRKSVLGSQSPRQLCSRSKRPYKISADAADITVVGEVKKKESWSISHYA